MAVVVLVQYAVFEVDDDVTGVVAVQVYVLPSQRDELAPASGPHGRVRRCWKPLPVWRRC
ncbi:MAG TPA: hypothetical protein VIR33_17355 [Thermopolyspora sp.]